MLRYCVSSWSVTLRPRCCKFPSLGPFYQFSSRVDPSHRRVTERLGSRDASPVSSRIEKHGENLKPRSQMDTRSSEGSNVYVSCSPTASRRRTSLRRDDVHAIHPAVDRRPRSSFDELETRTHGFCSCSSNVARSTDAALCSASSKSSMLLLAR